VRKWYNRGRGVPGEHERRHSASTEEKGRLYARKECEREIEPDLFLPMYD